jgi:hypothetical protein
MAEVKQYTTNFITTIIAVVIAVGLLPTLLLTIGNVSGIPLLSVALVGTIAGAGVVLFIVRQFI